MAVITFSIKQSQQERLETYLKEGESLNLCAKRLLLNLIDDTLDEPLDDKQSDRLTTLETIVMQLKDKIEALEANEQVQPVESKGINSSQLAKILGVDRSTISRWKAKDDPRLEGWKMKAEGGWIKQP